ncbi:MAG: nitrogenase component 1 [Treponema sp.]|uniref:nitrogenase component 1 n=1 Tax=Treponema sp. TaxID=166 RepID=UPI002A915C7F|nr:nitrogenase component 1 [Treponema sp.]MDY6397556.1 nitrogenase component 1 [Treponema sp.]
MEKCIERPRNLCSLHGALDVIGNIYRAIPVLHASPGCSMQASNHTNLYYLGGYHGLPSSNAYEKEVVFGGTQRLRETIKGSLEIMDGDYYAVLTGCSMGINGDDVGSVVEEFKDSPYPITSIDTAGFRGDTYTGYNMAFLATVKALAQKTKTEPLLVNIYGQPPSSDITLRGDFEEITRILSRIGVRTNTFFIRRDGIEEFKNSGNAALNINLSPWLAKNVDAYYKHTFGIETLTLNGWPVGPKDTAVFLKNVAEKLGIEKKLVEKVSHEEELYVYEYLDSLFGNFERHRFILVGESAKVLGIARFLVNVHGHIPLAVILTDSVYEKDRQKIRAEIQNLDCPRKADVYFENDVYEIEQIAKKYDGRATLFMGSSYEKKIAQKLNAFFAITSNPCLDKEILNRSHIGSRGAVSLMEDLYNHF